MDLEINKIAVTYATLKIPTLEIPPVSVGVEWLSLAEPSHCGSEAFIDSFASLYDSTSILVIINSLDCAIDFYWVATTTSDQNCTLWLHLDGILLIFMEVFAKQL